ncbi:MAG: hypothetical protein ACQETH_13555 [Candidatus Rifleibacteriota bacterium]
MKKTTVIFLFGVILLSLSCKLFAFPGSPALVSMMEQCEKTYLLPQNTNFNELSTRHSLVNVAMVLGFGMQIQRKNAGTDPHKIKKFEALERDVFAVLDWMVKKKKNIDNNGEKVTFQDLKWAYQKSLQGDLEPKRLTFTIRPFRDTWMICWRSKSIGGWSPLHRPL